MGKKNSIQVDIFDSGMKPRPDIFPGWFKFTAINAS
jgi:hypothetical protein